MVADMTDSTDELFWINDARRELVLAVRRSDLWPEEIKGPMVECIRTQLNALSHSLGNLELVYFRTKQGYVTLGKAPEDGE